jgi:plasmid stabilization system protein ParE
MAEILITAPAEEEYVDSLRWYASRSEQAAQGFEHEFARALDAIANDPDSFPLCDDHHRFVLLARYPFQVIYRRGSRGDILIVAVAHTRRAPDY